MVKKKDNRTLFGRITALQMPIEVLVTLMCAGWILLVSCSNSLKFGSSQTSSVGSAPQSVGKVEFTPLSIGDLKLSGQPIGTGFTAKNKLLILQGDGTSVGVDLEALEPVANVFKPTVLPDDTDANIYPIGNAEYWAFSKSRITIATVKEDGTEVVQRADVKFNAQPEVLSLRRSHALVRVGDLYQVFSAEGKIQITLSTPLDYRGRTTPISNIAGAGLVGDDGFWISDGEKVVVFRAKSNGEVDVQVIKFGVQGLDGATLLSYQFELVEKAPKLSGYAFAHDTSNGQSFKSQNLDPEAAGGPAVVVEIEDASIRELVKQNCVSCHGPQGGFNEALKVSSWKSNANALKTHLEANSMPPGVGLQIESRKKLAAFLKDVSGVEAQIREEDAQEERPEQDDPKLAEFNDRFKNIIETSCMGCHDHIHGRAAPARFETIKANARAMKGRIDSTTRPMPPANAAGRISAENRAALSQWLGTLNP